MQSQDRVRVGFAELAAFHGALRCRPAGYWTVDGPWLTHHRIDRYGRWLRARYLIDFECPGLAVLYAIQVAPAVDSVAPIDLANSGTSRSWSHTCSGANRALVVLTASYDAANTSFLVATTGAQYNSVNMTDEGSANESRQTAELWTLLNPASGPNTVDLTWDLSARHASTSISFTGVHQTTGFGALAAANSASGNPSVTVTTGANDLIVDVVGTRKTAGDPTVAVGADQTERSNGVTTAAGNNVRGGTSTQLGSDGGVMTWTITNGDGWWAQCGISLAPSAGGLDVPLPLVTGVGDPGAGLGVQHLLDPVVGQGVFPADALSVEHAIPVVTGTGVPRTLTPRLASQVAAAQKSRRRWLPFGPH